VPQSCQRSGQLCQASRLLPIQAGRLLALQARARGLGRRRPRCGTLHARRWVRGGLVVVIVMVVVLLLLLLLKVLVLRLQQQMVMQLLLLGLLLLLCSLAQHGLQLPLQPL
jgi:cobalamin biosynthesis protein CobD/CbiB